MNKITFPRTSYDGSQIDQKGLEDWFINAKVEKGNKNLVNAIENNLNSVKNNYKSSDQQRLLNLLIKNLQCILLADPQKLERYTKCSDSKFKNILKNKKNKATKFNKAILKAFNYEGFRKNILITLTEKLNIKTCPYCNMHYTLFAENGKSYSKKLTKFQFDHFFDKADYPFLSMSLYNLIPSCAVCNQGKSKGKISLKFHPYYSDIASQFKFRVEDPLPLLCGGKDRIEIKLETDFTSKKDVDEFNEFNNMFNIQTLYRRHRDVVQEVFDKAYMETYYYSGSFLKFLNTKQKDYFERLLYGTYLSATEIEKRPMSKFIQDIREQALSIYPASHPTGKNSSKI